MNNIASGAASMAAGPGALIIAILSNGLILTGALDRYRNQDGAKS